MKEFTFNILVRIQEYSFFRAARHTMAMLMPIAVVGSYFKVLNHLVAVVMPACRLQLVYYKLMRYLLH